MIINNILEKIFGSVGNIAVLRVLNERTVGISGRETAKLANVSLRTAQIALSNLEALKIVKRQVGGREHSFTLNRNHIVTGEIIEKLFTAERKIKKLLFNKIAVSLKDISLSVLVFGSVARSEETIESDLDICVIYSGNKYRVEKAVHNLQDNIYNEFGVVISPIYFSKKKFDKLLNEKKSIAEEIIRDGKVICGFSKKKLRHG